MLKIIGVTKGLIKRSSKLMAQSVHVLPQQESKTPQSPVVFDSQGLSSKQMTIHSLGVSQLYFFGSNAQEDTANPDNPVEPAGWTLLGEFTTVEPRPYTLPNELVSRLSPYRWIKVDRKRGEKPQIDFFSTT